MIQPSQNTVNGVVRAACYKGSLTILGRYSDTEKLYDETESSMDELTGFSPEDTSGFIAVQAIRIKSMVKLLEKKVINYNFKYIAY